MSLQLRRGTYAKSAGCHICGGEMLDGVVTGEIWGIGRRKPEEEG
jgi:hypothetical protein